MLLYRRAGGLTPEDQKLIAENAQEAAKVPLAGTALPAFVDGKPAPQQVTQDGTTAFTVVPLAPGKSEQVAESITELRTLADDVPGLQFHVTGASALLNDINTAVESADVVLVLVTGPARARPAAGDLPLAAARASSRCSWSSSPTSSPRASSTCSPRTG